VVFQSLVPFTFAGRADTDESKARRMALVDAFLTALMSAGILGILSLIAGIVFKPTYEKFVQHRFDRSLEQFKSERREAEEKLRSQLSKQQVELDALRAGALSGMATRNTMLDKRRIEAVEKLWAAVIDLRPFSTGTAALKKVDLVKMLQAAGKPETQKAAAALLQTLGLKDVKSIPYSIDKERLFVPPLLWAKFEAYRTLIFVPFLVLNAAQFGLGEELLDLNAIADVAKKAMPRAADVLNEVGIRAVPVIAELLHDELLSSIADILDSPMSDARTVEQAQSILKAVAKLPSAVDGAAVQSIANLPAADEPIRHL
jgi:hypothetical protein